MAAVGWAVLPITPSLRGLGAQLSKELMEPARKAARAASADIEGQLAEAAKRAAADVKKARDAEVKATEAVTAAETKLARERSAAQRNAQSVESAELKLKATREKAARDVAAAEDALQRARSSGEVEKIAAAESRLSEVRARADSSVLDKENALSRARDRVASSADKVAAAEDGVKRAKDKAANAAENVTAATKRLDSAQSATTDEFEEARAELRRFNSELAATGDEMVDTASKSSTLGEKMRAGLGKIGTGVFLGVGAQIGSTVTKGFGQAIAGGFDRLQSVEMARTSLQGLGHDAQAVETIMTNAMDSVKGTAFGFGDAAGLAGTLVASGIEPGQELERVLRLVGDSAAITGSDLNEMGSIWAKVAANQKLSSQELNQFLDRNLGLLPALAEHYGVTGEEARKLISEGKVGFEDLADVMEGMVGGAALGMGDTFSGSFANMRAALSRFGAQLLAPVFENAPKVFASITGAVDGLGERLEPVIASFSERMGPVIADFAERLGPAIESAINGVADAFVWAVGAVRDLTDWLQRNQAWLVPLAAAAGVAAGAYGLLVLQMKVAAAWSKIMAAGGLVKWLLNVAKGTQAWTAAQAAFNLVANANPVFLIVTGLVALGAALWAFFTRTETGRELWSKFTDALASGWEWVKGAFTSAWETIEPILSALWDTIKTVGAVVMTVLAVPFVIAWNLISGSIKFAWENVIKPYWALIGEGLRLLGEAFTWVWHSVIKPAWDGLGAGIRWVIDTLVMPAWDMLKIALDAVGQAFVWAWANVIKPAWDALGIGIRFVYDTIIVPVWTAMRAGLDVLGQAFVWVWLYVIKPTWDAFGTGIRLVWDTVVKPTWDALRAGLDAVGAAFVWSWNNVIKPVWDAFGNGIRWVLDTVVHPAFEGLKTGLGYVRDAFQTAVDFIGQMWDRIKGITARPIKFVIDTVYNNGIRAVWNKVAGWLGLDELDEMPMPHGLGDFARGGVLPGYTPGRDVYRFVEPRTGMHIGLSGGEAIMRPEFTRAVGGPEGVERLNRLAMSGKWLGFDGDLGGYAGGGVVESIVALVGQYFPGMSITSTYRNTNDHHGAGLAVDFSNGYDTTPQMQAAARFFHDNYGPGLLELIHWPLNGWQNIKNGAPLNYGEPTNSQHRNHVHVAAPAPLGPPGSPITPIDSGGGAGTSMIGSLVSSAFSAIMDPILDALPDFGGGLWGRLPGALVDKLVDGARQFFGSKTPAGGGSVTPGSGPVVDQVKEAMAAYGWDKEPYWSAIDFIIGKESGWNPLATNPSSGAFGLPQFNPMGGNTLGAYLPDRNPNPKVQGAAMARYIRDRYGNPLAARDFWVANGWYDDGGVLPPGVTLAMNGTGQPEAILTALQWRDIGRLVDALFDLTPEMRRLVDDGIVALEEFTARAAEVAEEMRPEWEAAVAAMGPKIASSIGDSVADFFGFGEVVSRVLEIRDAFTPQPESVPSAVSPEPAVATVEPADESPGEGDDKEVKADTGEVPSVVIENVYAHNDEDVLRAGLREVKRVARSASLAGGWW